MYLIIVKFKFLAGIGSKFIHWVVEARNGIREECQEGIYLFVSFICLFHLPALSFLRILILVQHRGLVTCKKSSTLESVLSKLANNNVHRVSHVLHSLYAFHNYISLFYLTKTSYGWLMTKIAPLVLWPSLMWWSYLQIGNITQSFTCKKYKPSRKKKNKQTNKNIQTKETCAPNYTKYREESSPLMQPVSPRPARVTTKRYTKVWKGDGRYNKSGDQQRSPPLQQNQQQSM